MQGVEPLPIDELHVGQRVRATVLAHQPWGFTARLDHYAPVGASIDLIRRRGEPGVTELAADRPSVGTSLDMAVGQIRPHHQPPGIWVDLTALVESTDPVPHRQGERLAAIQAFVVRPIVMPHVVAPRWLAVVIRPDLSDARILEVGGYGFLSRGADSDDLRVQFVVPLQRALRAAPQEQPPPVYDPAQGWTDVGLVFDRWGATPPPLLFDLTGVPPGRWWLHTQAGAVAFDLTPDWQTAQLTTAPDAPTR